MKNLHIPSIGETITLAAPWTFKVHEEPRNISLIKQVDPSYTGRGYGTSGVYGPERCNKSWVATLPEGLELKVDRIYIRNGRSDFNSVTFRCSLNGKSVRFWAKLNDVNRIIMEEKQ